MAPAEDSVPLVVSISGDQRAVVVARVDLDGRGINPESIAFCADHAGQIGRLALDESRWRRYQYESLHKKCRLVGTEHPEAGGSHEHQ